MNAFPRLLPSALALLALSFFLPHEGGCQEPSRKVGLSTQEGGKLTVVEGASYRAVLLSDQQLFSVDLKSGSSFVPLITKSSLVLRGCWERLLDQEGQWRPPGSVSSNPDGTVVARISGKSPKAKFSSETVYRPDSIDYSCKVDILDEIPKCMRVSLEMEPSWQAFAGSSVSAELPDGSRKPGAIPSAPAKDGVYQTILSFKGKSLAAFGAYGRDDAGFKIEGDSLMFNLEFTGESLKWQAGAPLDVPKSLHKGDSVSFSFRMSFRQPDRKSLSPQSMDVSVDLGAPLGPKISPYLFGSQIGTVGHGVKREGMRGEWQNNPKRDEEFRRYLKDSGVTFLRGMFNVLHPEVYQSEKDPISPYDGAPSDFSMDDELLDGLKELGVELEPVLAMYCPPWLSTKRESPNHKGLWITHRAPPKDISKLAAIFADMVRHYNVERKAGVKLWDMGNEPDDWTRYWIRGTLDEYVELFKATVKAMREVDPSVKIAGPSLANFNAKAWPENKLDWKDEFMKRCEGFDEFSFHIYKSWHPAKQIKEARDVMARNGAGAKTLSVSEYNLTAGDCDSSSEYSFDGALYVCSMLKEMAGCGVDRAVFFGFTGTLGLLGEEAGGKLSPHPSYHAFKMHAALGRFKNGKVLPASCSDKGATAFACRHEDGKGFSVIASSNSPFAESLRLSVSLKGGQGSYSMKRFVYNDGASGVEEAPASVVDIGRPVELVAGGRSVALLVFRPLGEKE